MGIGLGILQQYGSVAWLFLIFKAFMLVDCIRTGNDRMWYVIVFVPFGEFAYFFMFKAQDPALRKALRTIIPRARVSIELLRREAEQSPSFKNREQYADALLDARRYPEARILYEQMLHSTSDNRSLLLRLARCARSEGLLKETVELLGPIVEADIKYDDYKAALELAAVNAELGQHAEAVALLRRVTAQSSRLDLRLELARALLLQPEKSTADIAHLLDEIMADFRSSPAFYRRENRRVFRETRKLRGTIA